jgi:hypothetical protein
MKTASLNHFVKFSILAVCCSVAFAAPAARAAFTTWDLNPDNLNESANSSSHDFTVDGHTITATGYDNQNGVGNLHTLYFKNDPIEPDEHGLGIIGTPHNELQAANGSPLHFIQLNLSSIIAAGFINGRLSVGSVQPGELFQLYGSNQAGMLGTALFANALGAESDNAFVALPDFGTYQYISIAAIALDVLPVAFQAELVPVPEAATFVPVALLAIGAMLLEIRRRRRAAA